MTDPFEALEHVYFYYAEVVRWVDGDTVDLKVELGFHLTTESRFRLYGIDTPERGRPGYKEAIEFVNTLAPVGTLVLIESHPPQDKYGRYLTRVYPIVTIHQAVEVGSTLISAGLAVAYYGGTKQ